MSNHAQQGGMGRRASTLKALADGRQTNCSICRDEPLRMIVNGLVIGGASKDLILKHLGTLGFGVRPRTLGSHIRDCLANDREVAVADLAAQDGKPDFAVMVQAKAIARLKAGELDVNTQHGLNAQALIDRREEKTQDRDLMLSLARVMSGALGTGPPDDLIEGVFRDVTPAEVLPRVFTDGEDDQANGWVITVGGDS